MKDSSRNGLVTKCMQLVVVAALMSTAAANSEGKLKQYNLLIVDWQLAACKSLSLYNHNYTLTVFVICIQFMSNS